VAQSTDTAILQASTRPTASSWSATARSSRRR